MLSEQLASQNIPSSTVLFVLNECELCFDSRKIMSGGSHYDSKRIPSFLLPLYIYASTTQNEGLISTKT